jgi:hypothetical protein
MPTQGASAADNQPSHASVRNLIANELMTRRALSEAEKSGNRCRADQQILGKRLLIVGVHGGLHLHAMDPY